MIQQHCRSPHCTCQQSNRCTVLSTKWTVVLSAVNIMFLILILLANLRGWWANSSQLSSRSRIDSHLGHPGPPGKPSMQAPSRFAPSFALQYTQNVTKASQIF